MKCSVHANRTGVAQCKRCNKVMCKACSDRCINTDEKYVGLCNECVLVTGINCNNHPSQKAVARCDRCGKFLCSDCFDAAWDGVCDVPENETKHGLALRIAAGLVGGVGDDIGSFNDHDPGRYCHACVSDAVGDVVAGRLGYTKHVMKSGLIWVGVLSALGLIIGLATQISDDKSAGDIFAGAWLGIGIGCSVRALLLIPRLVFGKLKECIVSRGFTDGIKVWFAEGLLGGLVLGLIFCFVGAVTGPIIPLIYMLIRKSQFKKIGYMIERNSELCATLQNAHTKPSDSATKSEIHQGADTFAEDIMAADRMRKPVLWFLR
jgi:hypothetical protein